VVSGFEPCWCTTLVINLLWERSKALSKESVKKRKIIIR